MDVIVWHNAKCATSRKVVEMIRRRGIEPVLIDYLRTPPSRAEIKAALKAMGLKPRDLLRRRGTPDEALGLGQARSDAELIAAMAEHPLLIERPVVRTVKGTRLCRPPERVTEIL
jgi:arsenate reductase